MITILINLTRDFPQWRHHEGLFEVESYGSIKGSWILGEVGVVKAIL